MVTLSAAVFGAQGLLGLAELAAGGTKLAGAEDQVELFDRLGYPQWFRLTTGGAELLAGLALLVGLAVQPALALGGSVLALAILAGAIGSHARAGDPLTQYVPAALLFALAAVVAWGRLAGVP